jgi:hypothetical protein
MHDLKSAAIAVFVAWVTTAPAFAGEIAGTVTSVIPSVSLSIGGSEPAASYSVTLTNTSNSGTLNVARLAGTTTVVGGSADAKAIFKSAAGASCATTNIGGTSVDCNVGSLALGESKTFTVTFKSPTSGTSIQFAWQAVFDNGTPPGNSNGEAGTASTGLDPIDSAKVVSDIPPNLAVTFFTGAGVATPSDPWVTIVKAPSVPLGTTATVVEDVAVSQCSPDLLDCRTTTMTIPSTFGTPGARPLVDAAGNSPFLRVTILRDASTIAKGAKIDAAVLYYKHDPDAPGLGDVIQSCDDLTLPKAGVPCEDRSQRLEYPKKNTPKTPVTPGFESDWRFIIYLHDNGRITN